MDGDGVDSCANMGWVRSYVICKIYLAAAAGRDPSSHEHGEVRRHGAYVGLGVRLGVG